MFVLLILWSLALSIGKDGKRETVLVKAPVRALGAATPEHKH